MGRKSETTIPAHDTAAVLLGKQISEIVMRLAKRRGYNQTTFATKLGYSRSSFSQILNSGTTSRLWRLSALCGAAQVLGIPLSEIIRAAERRAELGDAPLPLSLVLGGTKAGSPERLVLLVREAFNSSQEDDGVLYGEDYEVQFGCRPRDIQLGAPDFYKDFVSGKIGDADALAILNAAVRWVWDHGGPTEFPLWGALNQVWKEDEK